PRQCPLHYGRPVAGLRVRVLCLVDVPRLLLHGVPRVVLLSASPSAVRRNASMSRSSAAPYESAADRASVFTPRSLSSCRHSVLERLRPPPCSLRDQPPRSCFYPPPRPSRAQPNHAQRTRATRSSSCRSGSVQTSLLPSPARTGLLHYHSPAPRLVHYRAPPARSRYAPRPVYYHR
ncbi:hypothetical protein C8J57DRAFT_1301673, partial [Mycena rebaudengoi]